MEQFSDLISKRQLVSKLFSDERLLDQAFTPFYLSEEHLCGYPNALLLVARPFSREPKSILEV